MRIEVLCTGDELLTGVTADTNSPWFMARLLRLGERVSRTTIVGDELEAIRDALLEVAGRADVVLVSGGLGPTADDLTVDAAAQAAGVPAVEHAPTLERIRARFAERGLALTPNNLRQARVPQGAEVVQNDAGTSPMFWLELGRGGPGSGKKCLALFVPGVPREYQHLVEHHVLPRLRALREQTAGASFHAFRILKTLFLPESHLDAKVAPIAKAHPNVRLGFRTDAPENHLELLATGVTQAEADASLKAAEHDARAVLGPFVFGADEQSLAEVVLSMLARRGETVACAESCTGGLVSALLTDVPGSSAMFPGALVPYDPRLKTEWLDVPAALIDEKGVVSAEVAQALADGVCRHAGTSWGLGITGYAGPTGGDAREPIGSVYIAVSGAGRATVARHLFHGDRARVRKFAAAGALDALRHRLEEEERTR